MLFHGLPKGKDLLHENEFKWHMFTTFTTPNTHSVMLSLIIQSLSFTVAADVMILLYVAYTDNCTIFTTWDIDTHYVFVSLA